MASVTIDIPGIGNVEAKNAASEATLRELVNAIKGLKGGKGGGAGGGDNKIQADRNKNQKEDNDNQKESTNSFKKLSSGIGSVVGGFFTLGNKLTNTVGMFAQLDGSITDAADIFKKLPIVGGLVGGAFGAVAAAADKVTKSYITAASGGASFGGSMASFSAAASQAGMNMAEFGNLIKNNGEGMLGFGATTEAGAKNFANVSKQLRASSSELYALGMSTEEINNGLAKYGSMMKQQGLQGTQSNAQLAAGAKKYLTELDALAKITGTDRAAKEAEMQNTLKDAQFQGAMAGKSKEVRDSFLNTLGGLAGGMQGPLANFSKDILATGTATTEENQKLMSMMPKSAAMLNDMRGKMQRGEAVSEAERNALNNLMASEGEKASKQMGSAFASAPEFAGTMNALTLAQSMQKDGLKNATKEQKEAAAKTDMMNKKMQQFQQTLAELGNKFTMALASSGMLDVLMSSFKILGDLVTTYVLPAFMIFSDIIATVGGYLVDNLKPIFESIGNFIRDSLYPAFLTLASFILVDIVPVLEDMAAAVNDYVLPVFSDIADLIGTYVMPVFESIGTFIADNLMPIFLGLGTALAVYAAYQAIVNTLTFITGGGLAAMASGLVAVLVPLLPFALAVGGLVLLFKALYDGGWTFSSALDAIVDNFLNLLNKITFGAKGISDDELKARADKRDLEREKIATERSSETKKEARAEKAAELDKKIVNLKDKHSKKLGDANDKEAAAKEAALPKTDFNGNSIDILKSEVAIANGPTPGPVAKAETAKKEMEAKSDKDATDKAAAKKEEAKKEEGKKPAPAQETPETLLASLNTKLDQLILVNKNMKEVQDRQLTVQQGLSGDLFHSV